MLERVVPGNFLGSPLSATLGHREVEHGRRELVFFIKCDTWSPSQTIADEHGFTDLLEEEGSMLDPAKTIDVLTDIVEGVADIPQSIGEALAGEDVEEGSIDSEVKMEDEE